MAAEDNYKCLFSDSLVCYLGNPKLRWRLAFELYRRRTSQLKHSIAFITRERAGTWEPVLKNLSVFPAQRGFESDCAAVWFGSSPRWQIKFCLSETAMRPDLKFPVPSSLEWDKIKTWAPVTPLCWSNKNTVLQGEPFSPLPKKVQISIKSSGGWSCLKKITSKFQFWLNSIQHR